MSARGLDSESARAAQSLLAELDREATTPFEWALVRLMSIIIDALVRRDP